MTDDTTSPLTLAELEQILDQRVLYDGGGETVDLPELLRPLILRLLAGERERVAAMAETSDHIGRHRIAQDIRHMGNPT